MPIEGVHMPDTGIADSSAIPSRPIEGGDEAGVEGSVRLHLVGGFHLEIDGGTVDVQPAVRRLTAMVALTPRGLCRDFAAFQLWPDKAEPRAKANLRSTIWRLNQLGRPVLVASASQLCLAPEVWLDTRDGLDWSDDEEGGLGVARPFGTLLLDLLPDWYDEWLVIERERFRQLRLSALERRARDAIREGDPSRAIQLGLAALAMDGIRESAHRLVVQAHLLEGNEWEAERERIRFARCMRSAVA